MHLGLKTRAGCVEVLAMDITPPVAVDRQLIQSYGDGGFRISGVRHSGSIIVFPSDRYHQVTPITSGLRYSLVMWSLGQPWK